MNSSLDETKIYEVKTQLGILTNNLLDALESGDQTKVLAAQNAFTSTIASLWTATDEVVVDRRHQSDSSAGGAGQLTKVSIPLQQVPLFRSGFLRQSIPLPKISLLAETGYSPNLS